MNELDMLLLSAATDPKGIVAVIESQNLEDGTTRENIKDVAISELIALGANINSCDDNGNNALILAACYNCAGSIDTLLQYQDIAVNQPNKVGLTPLMEAVKFGNQECVIALMNHREIDANLKDLEGKTALTYALERNQLLVSSLNKHRNSSEPAAQEFILQILTEIEKNKLALNSIIHCVVNLQKNDGQEWKIMSEGDGENPPQLANPEIHELLIQEVVMEIAAVLENNELRGQIISNFNQKQTPSLCLITGEYPPIAGTKESGMRVVEELISLREWQVEYLVRNGANLEQACRIAEERTTYLYNNLFNESVRTKALYAGTGAAVSALINEVLDAQNLEEMQLIAAEDIASWRSNWLSKITDYHDYKGSDSAISYLSKKSQKIQTETLRLLLEKGVDPNFQDVLGRTAAMELYSNEEQLDLLVSYGARLEIKDNKGRSITKVSQGARFKEISERHYRDKDDEADYSYLTNDEDQRHISRWSDLVGPITKAIENLRNHEYPIAHLNSDNSVSLLIAKHSDKLYYEGAYQHHDDNDVIAYYMQQEFVTKQIELWRERFGFDIIGGQQLIEAKEHEVSDITEYKINLSPQNLDTIFKLDDFYVGYNKHASILNLNQQFNTKEGLIMIFPVWPIDEGKGIYSIRAAGCQLSEMPTLQIMKLLPNYETEIRPLHEEHGFKFHHFPEEVCDALSIDRDFLSFLQKFMGEKGVNIFSESLERRSDRFCNETDEAFLEIVNKTSDVHIVEIDETAKHFYAMYGNCSEEELCNCLSLEVDSLALLQGVKQYYKYEAGSQELETINQMIENEKIRSRASSITGPTTTIKTNCMDDFFPQKKSWKDILNNKGSSRDDSTITR